MCVTKFTLKVHITPFLINKKISARVTQPFSVEKKEVVLFKDTLNVYIN